MSCGRAAAESPSSYVVFVDGAPGAPRPLTPPARRAGDFSRYNGQQNFMQW